MNPLPAYLDDVTAFLAVEVFQAAQRLEAEGRSIVHLEFGEPDFPTPTVITEAAVAALRAGHTHYTHSLGLLPLREEIAAHLHKQYGVSVSPENILVSQGTSICTFLALLALLEPGDEVILPDPTYACYGNFVRLARGIPISVPVVEEEGFQIDPAAVRRAITPRTRAMLVCSPANPTGVVLRPEVMEQLGSLGIPIVSDEIYHGLTYGGSVPSMLSYGNEHFVLNGFSKYFAMTGWRLGYLVFPPAKRTALMKLHQNLMISAAETTQHAAIAALRHASPVCEQYRAEYDRRRVFMIEKLREAGLPLKYEPSGAFYIFADARHYDADSLRLAMDILEKAGVAVTPGCDFGAGGEGYLRFSYASSMENIADAMQRLKEYLVERA